jgi:Ricin-type beta-trefoil lectin domain-like
MPRDRVRLDLDKLWQAEEGRKPMTQAAEPSVAQEIKPVDFSFIQLLKSPPTLVLCPKNVGDDRSSLQVATPTGDPFSAGQYWGFLKAWPQSRLYRIFNALTGLCIDADGNDPHPGAETPLLQFPWRPGQQNQVWLNDGLWLLSGYTTAMWWQAGQGDPPQPVKLQPYQQHQNIPNTYEWKISGPVPAQLYYIQRFESGLCLTADPGGGDNPLTLTPLHSSGVPTQMWAFIAFQGKYRVFNVYNGLCADAAGNKNPPPAGTSIGQYGWRQQLNQAWTVTALPSPSPTPQTTLWTFASAYDSTKVWSGDSGSGSVQLEDVQTPVSREQKWRLVEISPAG